MYCKTAMPFIPASYFMKFPAGHKTYDLILLQFYPHMTAVHAPKPPALQLPEFLSRLRPIQKMHLQTIAILRHSRKTKKAQ
jgi:hypothetical protein